MKYDKIQVGDVIRARLVDQTKPFDKMNLNKIYGEQNCGTFITIIMCPVQHKDEDLIEMLTLEMGEIVALKTTEFYVINRE